MAENNDKSIFVLAIVCVLAIVMIVFFVDVYLNTHQNNNTPVGFQDNAAGAATAVVQAQPLQPVMQEGNSYPCAYAYLRDKLPPGSCPPDNPDAGN